jgi:poly(3-hydroxybutyrate) depolymerase
MPRPFDRCSPALLLLLACAQSSHPPAGTGGAAGEEPQGTGGSAGATATGGSGAAGAAGADAATPVLDAMPPPADAPRAAQDVLAAGDASATAGPSAGCGTHNPGGMFMIPAGTGQQPYLVVLPRSYDGTKPYPLVFYLHGRGNDLNDRPRNLETALAAADRAIVIYAKSITSGWEVEGRDQPAEHTTMLRAIRQRAFEQYCVDTGKVVMTGFSSGGNFIGYLQCTMAGEIAAAVIAGGSTHATCTGRLPSLVIVGRTDPSFAAAERSADYLRMRNGCAMTRMPGAVAPCESFDGCPAGASTDFCPFAGGHMWPGFAASAVADLLSRL